MSDSHESLFNYTSMVIMTVQFKVLNIKFYIIMFNIHHACIESSIFIPYITGHFMICTKVQIAITILQLSLLSSAFTSKPLCLLADNDQLRLSPSTLFSSNCHLKMDPILSEQLLSYLFLTCQPIQAHCDSTNSKLARKRTGRGNRYH